MTTKSVLILGPDIGVACTIDGLTAIELAQYAMGYYESLFKTLPVEYPEGRAAFIIDVLSNGYTECHQVTAWSGVPELVHFDFATHLPTPKEMLDHDTFGDAHALRLILSKFTNVL